MNKILFSWKGLPYYGVRCLQQYLTIHPEDKLDVVATPASVPFEEIEAKLGVKVNWVEPEQKAGPELLNLARQADVYVACGWATPVFNQLASVAKQGGARILLFSDNNWEPGLLKYVKAVKYFLTKRKFYDAAWVPGQSGRRLMNTYGLKSDNIFTGLYTGDKNVFYPPSDSPHERERSILFIGQLIHRKGILELCEAFSQLTSQGNNKGYILKIIGSGELEPEVKKYANASDSIQFLGFVQPESLASMLRKSMAMVLPSHQEHWGLVVHEAALSGNILLLTAFIGALEDFVDADYPLIMQSCEVPEIKRVLAAFCEISEERLEGIRTCLIDKSNYISVENWVKVLHTFASTK